MLAQKYNTLDYACSILKASVQSEDADMGFYRLAWSIAAWQILTPRDTITWVRDQMILPPVKFLRLTQLNHFVYTKIYLYLKEIITVSKIWKYRWKAYKNSDFFVPKTKKVKFFRNFLIIWRWTNLNITDKLWVKCKNY